MAELATSIAVIAGLVGAGLAIGLRLAPRWALPGLVALIAVAEALFGIASDAMVPVAIAVAAPWLIGHELAVRRRLGAELAARNAELRATEAAHAGVAVRAERARLARELHDVVAHHLAIIAVQAGAGRMATAGQEGAAPERLASIRGAAAQALEELRRLTGLLEAAPPEDLQAVVARARAAGIAVETSIPADLPVACAEPAHRVVQEALTNVLKHAPGATVHVRVAVRGDVLRVEVADTGGMAASALASTGSGAGLDGMRARVAARGGRLEAGPGRDGGWRVSADIPAAVIPRG